ncbi:MAG TPA: hypothetical protein VI386_03375, partial [Candidatus Sulfotelmatobacter sp.]
FDARGWLSLSSFKALRHLRSRALPVLSGAGKSTPSQGLRIVVEIPLRLVGVPDWEGSFVGQRTPSSG